MLLDIVRLAYDHPVITFIFIIGLAIVASEFRPIAIVKYEQRKDTEEKK